MRTIRAYELPGRLRISAYENKFSNLSIKLEIPVQGCRNNIALVCPANLNEAELCDIFDEFVKDCGNLTCAKVYELFLERFVTNHAYAI